MTSPASTAITTRREQDNIAEVVLGTARLALPDIAALTETIRELDPGTSAVVLRSSLPDFCLGRAPSPPRGPAVSPEQVRATVIAPILDLYETIITAPFPVVAAVRGRAHGLGFALAASCDLVLACEDASFALPEINAGFAPLLALTQLADILPRPLAFHMAAYAEEVDARRLWTLGAVAKLVPDDKLEATARQVASQATQAVRDVKHFLNRRTEEPHRSNTSFAADVLSAALSSA
ncbi:enoyl-CoA hydratase/isomerase family protein [Streptomyces sp. NPDC004609]|uniref:enoyl-CoA hydratase/isomerase family protein n=1 Tax=Streptomyces sp. NPDC004609 TaxID=3364704 RepID=UPI0036B20927